MRSYRKGSHAVHDLKEHLQIPVQRFDGKYWYQAADYYPSNMRHKWYQSSSKAGLVEIMSISMFRIRRSFLSVKWYVWWKEEFPQLRKRYWGAGYAAFSSGHVTDEIIQEYLKHHKNHPNHQDDCFVVEWLLVIEHRLAAYGFQSALAETMISSHHFILWAFSL